MFPPKFLTGVVDQNVLELTGSTPVTKQQKEVRYTYTYVKSKTKKGKTISFTETELKLLIANNVFKSTD